MVTEGHEEEQKSSISKEQQQAQEQVKVELADGQRSDPVSNVQNAQLKNLADTYRFHAELLDEQRGQLQGLKDHGDILKGHLDSLANSIAEWRDFLSQEKSRIEEQRPPVSGKTKRPFGGPGF